MSKVATQNARSSWLPLGLLVILGCSWGVHFPILRFAAEAGFSESGIVGAIISGVAMALLLIGVVRGRMPKFGARQIRFYLICAILGYVIPYFLALYAAARMDSGMLTIVTSVSPIMTLSLAALLRLERVTIRRVVGIGLGAASVAVLTVPQTGGPRSVSLISVLIALCVPASYSSYHIFVLKRWPGGLDSFQTATGEAVAAVCMLVPIFLFTGGADIAQGGWTTGHSAIAVLILLTTMDCYLYFEIVRLAGPVFVSQANFVTVVAGVLWGVALHGEQPGRWIWLSALLLLGSLAMLVRPSRPAAQEDFSRT